MACNQYRVQHRIEEQDVVRMQSGAKRQGRGLALPIDHLGLVDQVGGQDDDNQDVCCASNIWLGCSYLDSLETRRPPVLRPPPLFWSKNQKCLPV